MTSTVTDTLNVARTFVQTLDHLLKSSSSKREGINVYAARVPNQDIYDLLTNTRPLVVVRIGYRRNEKGAPADIDDSAPYRLMAGVADGIERRQTKDLTTGEVGIEQLIRFNEPYDIQLTPTNLQPVQGMTSINDNTLVQMLQAITDGERGLDEPTVARINRTAVISLNVPRPKETAIYLLSGEGYGVLKQALAHHRFFQVKS